MREPTEGEWKTPSGKYTVEKTAHGRHRNLWAYKVTHNETKSFIEFPAVAEYIRRCSSDLDIEQRWAWMSESGYPAMQAVAMQDMKNRKAKGVRLGLRAAA